VDPGQSRLFHPGPHVGLGQIEVPGHLADAAITALAELDGLRLELGSERATWSLFFFIFFFSMVCILDIRSGGLCP
jgi:hypothetical protein